MDVFKILWLLLVTWKFCFASTTTMDLELTTTTTIDVNTQTQTNNETTTFESTTESLDYATLEDVVSGDYNDLEHEFTTENYTDEITTNTNEYEVSVKDIFKESNKNEHRGVSVIKNWLKSTMNNTTANKQNNSDELEVIKNESLMQEGDTNSVIDKIVNQVIQEVLTDNSLLTNVSKENIKESGDLQEDIEQDKRLKESANNSEKTKISIQSEGDLVEEELLSKMKDNIKLVQLLDKVIESNNVENVNLPKDKLVTLPVEDVTTLGLIGRDIFDFDEATTPNTDPMTLNQEVEGKPEVETEATTPNIDPRALNQEVEGKPEVETEATTPNTEPMTLNQKVEGKPEVETITPGYVESFQIEDFKPQSSHSKTTTSEMETTTVDINDGELFPGETTTLSNNLTPSNEKKQELEVMATTVDINDSELFPGETTTLSDNLTPSNEKEQELEVMATTDRDVVNIENYNLEVTTLENEEIVNTLETTTTNIEENMDNSQLKENTNSSEEEVMANTEIEDAGETITTEYFEQNITNENEFLITTEEGDAETVDAGKETTTEHVEQKVTDENKLAKNNNAQTEIGEAGIMTTESNNMDDNTMNPIIAADETETGKINIFESDINTQSIETITEVTTNFEKLTGNKLLESDLSNSDHISTSKKEVEINDPGSSSITIVTDSSIVDATHQHIEFDNSNLISSDNIKQFSNNLDLEETGSLKGKHILHKTDEDKAPGSYNDLDFTDNFSNNPKLSEVISNDENDNIKELNFWSEDTHNKEVVENSNDAFVTTTILPTFDPSNKYLINSKDSNQSLDNIYYNENVIGDLENSEVKQVIVADNNLNKEKNKDTSETTTKSNNAETSIGDKRIYEENIAVTPTIFESEKNVENNDITTTSSNMLRQEEESTENFETVEASNNKEHHTEASVINKIFITEEVTLPNMGEKITSEGIIRNKDSRDPKYLRNIQTQSHQAQNFDFDVEQMKVLPISDINLQLVNESAEVITITPLDEENVGDGDKSFNTIDNNQENLPENLIQDVNLQLNNSLETVTITSSEEKNSGYDYKSINSIDNNKENLSASLTKNNFNRSSVNKNQEQNSAWNKDEESTTYNIIETTFISEEYKNTEPILTESTTLKTESESFEETTDATSENFLTTGFMKLFSYFSPVTNVPKLEDVVLTETVTELVTEVPIENIVTVLPKFDDIQEIVIKKIDLISSDNANQKKLPEIVSESIEFVNNGNFMVPNSTSISLTDLLKVIPLIDVTEATQEEGHSTEEIVSEQTNYKEIKPAIKDSESANNYEDKIANVVTKQTNNEELVKLTPIIDVTEKTQNYEDKLNQTSDEDYGEVTDSRANSNLYDIKDTYSTINQEAMKETQFNASAYIGTLMNRMIKNMRKTSIKDFPTEDITASTTQEMSTTDSFSNIKKLIVDNSEIDSPQITTLKSDDLDVNSMEEINKKIKEILNLQDLSTDYIDEIEDNFLKTTRKVILSDKPRLIGRVENVNDNIYLVYNISAVLVIQGFQMSIPSDAAVVGKWTSNNLNLKFIWKSDSFENFNNSVNFEIIDNFGRLFLNNMDIMIFDSRENEIIVRQKDNFNEESTDFDMINLDNIVLEDNIIMRFTDSYFKVIRPILAIDGSQSYRSKNLLALQIASGSACTFMILIATGTLIFRRIRHKARVFKVSL